MQIIGKSQTAIDADILETKIAEARAERDRRIIDAMKRVERYTTQTAAKIPTTDSPEAYAAILVYLQALRDVPEQAGFPGSVIWPRLDI